MSKRRRSDRARHWRRVVADWQASGLSRAEFCRRHELNYQTMTPWVRRFEESRGLPDGHQADAVGTGRATTRNRSVAAVRKRTAGGHEQAASGRRRTAVGDRPPAADCAPASFVEVSLPAAEIDSTRYEILLGHDRSIRLGAGFDADVLTRLIRAVESC